MNPHDFSDESLDALLRRLGPHVPCPELSPDDRDRLLSLIGEREARRSPARMRATGSRWRAAAMIGLVGLLGLTSLVLGAGLKRSADRLASSRGESVELLELLASARAAQPAIPVPDDTADLSADHLVVVTFDHALCPIARVTTPAFHSLAMRHAAHAARFLVLDVTGDRRDHAAAELDELNLRFAMLTPLGGETGVVKVLDTASGRVVCSAPGRLGIEQAETLLDRVSSAGGAS